MLANYLKAETLCGPYAFKCWCRYGDAKLTNIPRWQRSLEAEYKPITGVLIERPKETKTVQAEAVEAKQSESLW